MNYKSIIPCIYLKNGKLVKGFKDETVISDDPAGFSSQLAGYGADRLLLFDLSENDSEHEENILLIRQINKTIDIPSMAAGNINRLEDVKKLLYAGCKSVVLNMAKQSNIDLITQAAKRFGKEKMMACADADEQILDHADILKEYVSEIILLDHEIKCDYAAFNIIPFVNDTDISVAAKLLRQDCVCGLTGELINANAETLMELKSSCREQGISVNLSECSLSFDDLTCGENGLIPVVVQDYKTDEVLMVAYMNRESFDMTVKTGKMTYYSRSRQKLWIKGETSGHFQYVRSLYADCDKDTILARVRQIGAACHTGNRSCFFEEILSGDYPESNPLKVFENVFDVILDRKKNPKEGSYTNYLFDKGIDKILKKVGEEATEIVIAAKNPDQEEVKYEIADFLYHVMVLMAECDLTWDDIVTELANR
ncbi:MAG: bifunctional phosphoribosyl-AMP cyclohydrolase/phosphoribosyl-ATP diphosphatase HisIE [Lachnospiraceae bacterium]|nr:bifunctional phosphoribosyl-AMP cyclohydrolase/phosphoribosyl-ATP diphosphatase HisIE [Lachnospiraceae bacterium]